MQFENPFLFIISSLFFINQINILMTFIGLHFTNVI